MAGKGARAERVQGSKEGCPHAPQQLKKKLPSHRDCLLVRARQCQLHGFIEHPLLADPPLRQLEKLDIVFFFFFFYKTVLNNHYFPVIPNRAFLAPFFKIRFYKNGIDSIEIYAPRRQTPTKRSGSSKKNKNKPAVSRVAAEKERENNGS